MKKIVLATLIACAMSSVAMASPLTDYSKGNAALDITYRNTSTYKVDEQVGEYKLSDISLPGHGQLGSLNGKSNVEWGFTYGIGNNWALQYRQATPKGVLNHPPIEYNLSGENSIQIESIEIDGTGTVRFDLEAKTRVEEYNVLYKMDKNFSLFTGIVRATPSMRADVGVTYNGDSGGGNLTLQGHDKNIWHFGVIATAPVAKKLTAYGIASFGSDYRNWEAGLGYQIDKNLEFNVNYRDMKVSNMTTAGISVNETSLDLKTDSTVKGWGFGITYKF